MADETDAGTIRGFVRWAMQPPQSYVMYLIAVVLIGGLSFYAGSLKPKTAPHVVPQSVSQPNGK
ncbi:MAG: hypothetical protein HXX15_10605 [Rhodopseudomonas sp.]|uniref:hypothetical protein n=1 Tax=Rhodopseudomonas sp. TaxID=1078 RepID=UPI00180D8678|nr:hypothetical protein [Rhodopseudomonas sp.]NVN86526.1 hypothetical protein [Rhodopseudomonas sp.]